MSKHNQAIPDDRTKSVNMTNKQPKPHILVVDDEREIREIAMFALKRGGFEALVAADEQQMWNHLEQTTPALIILDVMMPGRDGYQLCRTLRSHAAYQDIPIIIMTAHDEDIYARMSINIGAVHHLTKPFHPLELVERCTLLLQGRVERSDA